MVGLFWVDVFRCHGDAGPSEVLGPRILKIGHTSSSPSVKGMMELGWILKKKHHRLSLREQLLLSQLSFHGSVKTWCICIYTDPNFSPNFHIIHPFLVKIQRYHPCRLLINVFFQNLRNRILFFFAFAWWFGTPGQIQ